MYSGYLHFRYLNLILLLLFVVSGFLDHFNLFICNPNYSLHFQRYCYYYNDFLINYIKYRFRYSLPLFRSFDLIIKIFGTEVYHVFFIKN